MGLLDAVFEGAPIAIAVFDDGHRCVFANHAYASIAGSAAPSLTGRHVLDILPAGADIPRALSSAATGHPSEFFVNIARAGNEEPRVWAGVAFGFRYDGRPLVGTMMRDLTVRTLAERERELAFVRETISRAEAEHQRDFIRMVLQNAPIGISVTEGPDHRLTVISDYALERLKVRRESVMGRPVGESFPETFAAVRDVYDRVFQTGEAVRLADRPVPLPDGREIWVHASYTPVLDAAGAPRGVMALSLDVTDVHRGHQIVSAQRDILERLAEGGDLAGALDAIAHVVKAHVAPDALCSILLVGPDGTSLHHGTAPDIAPAYTAAIDGVPIGDEIGSCGTAAFRRERIIVEDIERDPLWRNYKKVALKYGLRACWSTPILGRDGRLLGTFAIYYPQPRRPAIDEMEFVDLLVPTAALAIERAAAERERQRLLAAERQARVVAEEANRSKDEFVAALSHELRTPLNAILGWTRMLRTAGLGPDGATRALEAIERNARAQTQLVEDLLDMSRIITGKLRLDVRTVELGSVVEGAVDTVRPAADAKGIQLVTIVDPRTAPITGDPDRLQQVIWNLLSNAIKFTPKDGKVQVVLRRVNSHVEIVVSDTGEGIPRDMLTRVFERFQQGAESGAKTAGLGLGLAIARHLVELHGGTIVAESEGQGKGATFTIALPVVAARLAGGDHPTAASGVAIETGSLPNTRILVVEDNADSRDMLAAVLSSAGARVRTAASAAEGLACISDWRPELIVSDIEMPGEDGYAFIRKLRAMPGGTAREMPAVAVTAYARVEDRIRALRAGFQMHVPKPVEPAELVAVVKAVLQQSSSADVR